MLPARRPADRPQLAAKMRLRALRRAAQRLALSGPQSHQRALLALPHRPTVANWGRFAKADAGLWRTAPCAEVEIPPAPMRWDPIPLPSEGLSLIEGVRTITTAGDAGSQA